MTFLLLPLVATKRGGAAYRFIDIGVPDDYFRSVAGSKSIAKVFVQLNDF